MKRQRGFHGCDYQPVFLDRVSYFLVLDLFDVAKGHVVVRPFTLTVYGQSQAFLDECKNADRFDGVKHKKTKKLLSSLIDFVNGKAIERATTPPPPPKTQDECSCSVEYLHPVVQLFSSLSFDHVTPYEWLY